MTNKLICKDQVEKVVEKTYEPFAWPLAKIMLENVEEVLSGFDDEFLPKPAVVFDWEFNLKGVRNNLYRYVDKNEKRLESSEWEEWNKVYNEGMVDYVKYPVDYYEICKNAFSLGYVITKFASRYTRMSDEQRKVNIEQIDKFIIDYRKKLKDIRGF